MKKRVLSFFLVLILMIGIIPEFCFAESGYAGDKLTWSFDKVTGTLTIEGTGEMNYTPQTILELAPWDSYKNMIRSVYIADGITSIQRSAFYGYSNLSSVYIPDSVTHIGAGAFYGCKKLADDKGYIIFKNIIFQYLGSETDIVIPEGILEIGEFAFYENTQIKSVKLPKSLISIGDGAFRGCLGLADKDGFVIVKNILFDYIGTTKNVVIPSGVTEISTGVTFFDKGKIETAYIPDSVTKIPQNMFRYCNSLKTVRLPKALSSVGDGVFENCTSLESVTMPKSMPGIPNGFFYNCLSLKSVIIPDGVEYIGNNAFNMCEKLTSVEIPETVNRIGVSAFEYCTGIKKIVVPTGVTQICDRTFANSSLESVSLPNGIKTIGEQAFEYCHLTELTIPDTVTTIEKYAFFQCSVMKTVKMPKALEFVDADAFMHCYALENIHISDIAAWCSVEFTNIYSNPLFAQRNLYYNGKLLTDLVIPEGVKTITSSAFRGCYSIKTVKFPKSLILVGGYAFNSCSYLESAEFKSGVTTIGESAFSSCNSLRSINLPDTITTIKSRAFEYGTNLKKIALPKNLTHLGERVFAISDVTTIYIPKNLTTVSENAFYGTEIKYVYYEGSAKDRAKMGIGQGNETFENARWYYNQTGLPECKYDNDCDTECNLCGTYRPAAHKFSEFSSDDNATIEKDGTKSRVCSVCKHKETVTDVGSKIILKDTSKIFKDVPKTAWFKNQVDYVCAYGIFNGTTETTFLPNASITRAQFVQVLANLSGVDTSNKNVKTKFRDVPKGKWYTPAVKWAFENGIVSGTGETTFSPDAPITR